MTGRGVRGRGASVRGASGRGASGRGASGRAADGWSGARLILAGAAARLLYRALVRRPPVSEETWTRVNHRGDRLTLLEGPAACAAAAAAAIAVPGLDMSARAAIALAGAGAGAVGCYDDLAGGGDRRGLRGHLGALAKGQVTTGAIKIIGVGAAGLGASLLLARRGRTPLAAGREPAPGPAAADVVINAALIAGMANLVNLFDLRPGRAIKVSLLAAAAIGATGPDGRAAAAAPAGAALGLLGEDLGERAMLGDAGANALGAMLGAAAAASLPRGARAGAVAVITGLTIASEKVSFTKVIERTPALRWLDMLGRRPVLPVAPAPAPSAAGPTPAGSPASARSRTAGLARGDDPAAGSPPAAPRGAPGSQPSAADQLPPSR